MRNSIRLTFLMAVFIMLCGVSTANAQLGTYALRFDVPFEFVVEGKSFSPGRYKIERMPGIRDPATMLMMRGPSGKVVTMLNTIPDESAYGYGDTAITLKRVDGRYYLSGIMIEGQFRGYEVPASRHRRDASARVVTIRRAGDSGF